jgi:predicted LPLAT superfamily acyltransferase
MAEWEGKSRGNPLGYRIFVFILKLFGIFPAYFLLVFVAFYYVLFAPKTTPHILHFFQKKIGVSKWKSYLKLYQTYFLFGQTLIDRVVVSAKLSKRITSTSNGAENLRNLVAGKRGGILLGSHVGNWGIASQFLTNYDQSVNVLVFDAEHEQIRQYLKIVTGGVKFNAIVVKDDLSHIYEIGEALQRNEIVCITADRFLPGQRTFNTKFFGEEAQFPAGPFQLTKSFKAPYTFVYGFKETLTHYNCYAKPPREVSAEVTAQSILDDYASDLEKMVKSYPEQWFNFFDFWQK